jgi:hypothetical protein
MKEMLNKKQVDDAVSKWAIKTGLTESEVRNKYCNIIKKYLDSLESDYKEYKINFMGSVDRIYIYEGPKPRNNDLLKLFRDHDKKQALNEMSKRTGMPVSELRRGIGYL